METERSNQLDGWAVIEVFGHAKYAGYITTEAYGSAVLFRVDVPALEARERVTKQPGYVGGRYVPAGATVIEGAVTGYTKLLGVSAIFSITPCTEEVVLRVVEEIQARPLMSVDVPPGLALPAAPWDDEHAYNDADSSDEADA
jgi:hypothetical protein